MRHPPFGDVVGVAVGHVADQLQAHGVAVGQRQHLRGGDEALAGGDPGLDRLRAHQLHPGLDRGVGMRQRGPAQGDDMAGGPDLAQVELVGRQHRAVVRPLKLDGDRVLVLDADDAVAGLEIRPAVGGAVLCGVRGVHLLDEEVLIVEVGRGDSPAQPRVAPGQHQRHAGNCAADDATGLELQPGEVEQPRRR
jgi:hypothetical protein